MRSNLISSVLCLIFCIISNPVHAAMLYVNQQTKADKSTFNTISDAVKVAQPGDTVLISSGIYRESVNFTRSGEPGKPITLMGMPGDPVIITGADVITDWEPLSKDQNRIWVKKNLKEEKFDLIYARFFLDLFVFAGIIQY